MGSGAPSCGSSSSSYDSNSDDPQLREGRDILIIYIFLISFYCTSLDCSDLPDMTDDFSFTGSVDSQCETYIVFDH